MKNLLMLMTICYLFSSCSSEKLASSYNGGSYDQGKLIEQGNRKVVNNSSNNLSIAKDNSSSQEIVASKIMNYVTTKSETETKQVNQNQVQKTAIKKVVKESSVKISTPEKLIIKQENIAAKSLMKKENAKNAPAPSGGKSWIVAVLLCFFLGGLGIHRFYLGYTGIGILELLTGGFFGILWMIDFVRILIKNLKPKDGDYK